MLPFRLLLSLFLLGSVVASCPNCSKNGYCDLDDKCICYSGYFGDSCSQAFKDNHESTTIILQVVLGIIYLLLFVQSATAFYYSQKRQATSLILVTNVRSIVFGLMAIVGVTEGFYVVVDPWSYYFMPRIANRLLHIASFPVGIITFTSILFHWIELIQTSIKTMKKEHMMQSINVNYRGKEVTVEDMVERVHFLQRLRIPFFSFLFILTLAVFAIEIARNFNPQYTRPMMGALYASIGLCWALLLAGYLIYGRRLLRLMPFELTKKVHRLTRKLTMLSAFILLCFAIMVPTLVAISSTSMTAVLSQYVVIELLIGLICHAIISVFLHWYGRFPFVAFSETQSRSSTLHKTPTTDTHSNPSVELEISESYNDR